jgi:hypothetical protein
MSEQSRYLNSEESRGREDSATTDGDSWPATEGSRLSSRGAYTRSQVNMAAGRTAASATVGNVNLYCRASQSATAYSTAKLSPSKPFHFSVSNWGVFVVVDWVVSVGILTFNASQFFQ